MSTCYKLPQGCRSFIAFESSIRHALQHEDTGSRYVFALGALWPWLRLYLKELHQVRHPFKNKSATELMLSVGHQYLSYGEDHQDGSALLFQNEASPASPSQFWTLPYLEVTPFQSRAWDKSCPIQKHVEECHRSQAPSTVANAWHSPMQKALEFYTCSHKLIIQYARAFGAVWLGAGDTKIEPKSCPQSRKF